MNARNILRCLLWAMRQPRTFYILGAGTSYGLVPVTQKMRSFIATEYHSVGSYSITSATASPLFERVIGNISADEQDIQEILLTRMPLSAQDLLTQRALWIPKPKIIPAQYEVFNVVGAPATLFNFNLDGLASFYCDGRHKVLEPHGRIDHQLFEHADYRVLLEDAIFYELPAPHLTSKLLPSPEPVEINLRSVYSRARRLFFFAQAVVVIGYSFGERSSGFDDVQSFEFLISLLKRRPCPVFILSLTPHQLAEHLRERLLTHSVYSISVRWELFAAIILALADPIRGLNKKWYNRDLEMLLYETAYS